MSAHGHAPSSNVVYLIFGVTLVLGFIAGIIIYLQSNTGKEGDGAMKQNTNGFTILAYTYGGCAKAGCSSYRISENGSYTYIVRGQGAEEKKFEDTLSDKQMTTLRILVSKTNLIEQSESTFTGTCAVTYDGVAYRYDITYKDVQVNIDSCIQNLEETELFDTLQSYFTIFSVTHDHE